VSDANHVVANHICSRYFCGERAVVDTEAGAMCLAHSDPLMFQVQMPYDRAMRRQEEFLVPWGLVRDYDERAQRNHGGQTLARLSERGGLSACELLAVLECREWRPMPHEEAMSAIKHRLAIYEAAK
jgi:hypothetical protein